VKICSVEGCGRPHLARNFCVNHYAKWLRAAVKNGTPRSSRSKLTKQQIEEVRAAPKEVSGLALAERFGISPSRVSNIRRYKPG
jgi:predicted DNA binding protein